MKKQHLLSLLAVASVMLAVAGGCAPKEPEKNTAGDPIPVDGGPKNSGNSDPLKTVAQPAEHRSDPMAGRNDVQSGQSTSSTSNSADDCLSNIKQLALGILMFCADNEDKYSLTAGDWTKKIEPYLKNTKLFTCPDDSAGATSYSFNGALAGKTQSSIPKTSQTVLIYEGKNGQLDFRHDGRAVVAFSDGHASMVTKDSATKLLWKP